MQLADIDNSSTSHIARELSTGQERTPVERRTSRLNGWPGLYERGSGIADGGAATFLAARAHDAHELIQGRDRSVLRRRPNSRRSGWTETMCSGQDRRLSPARHPRPLSYLPSAAGEQSQSSDRLDHVASAR